MEKPKEQSKAKRSKHDGAMKHVSNRVFDRAFMLGLEWGYKSNEKGLSLEATIQLARKVLKRTAPK